MEENKFILYEVDNKDVVVDIIFQEETLWMSQKQMADVFDVNVSTINEHLKNVYESKELDDKATIGKFPIVQKEGNREVSRNINFYNLDAIISVGYRVNSQKATRFRQWATKVLKDYMIKGFALDDDRLKQGQSLLGTDYFKELLERIRSIRASEQRIYKQITDIFAEVSSDYDPNSPVTKTFFATVQNKFHFAITGKTAAEIIHEKADKDSPNMGLTTWKNSPDGRILKSDITVAKNYLTKEEIRQLERNISAFFDYIEGQIERRNDFTMEQFAESVDRFLSFNDYEILPSHGSISKRMADEKANLEYIEFNKTQVPDSDFMKFIKEK